MARHKQTVFEHGKGNALQACIATVLGVAELGEVPNFIESCVPPSVCCCPTARLLAGSRLTASVCASSDPKAT